MKAEELKIFNLLKTYGQDMGYRTLISIEPDGVKFLEQEERVDYDLIEPIPLTEGWLERFGFKKPAYSWIGDRFHLTEWDEYPLNWCVAFNKNNAVIINKLKYVHQLQNLYYAITGEELILKK